MFDLIYRFDPEHPEAHQMPATAEEALAMLVKGNRDFAEMTGTDGAGHATRVIAFDPQSFGWGVTSGNAPVQAPFAAILGCADARVPTEMVFSKGCNELFVVRVAGNVLGNECLGSLRYAVHHFPDTLKLLVVLAHAACGAVTEAVDVYLQPERYIAIATDHPLRSIQDQILVAARSAALAMETLYGMEIVRNPGYRAALVEAAVVVNAAWSAYCLHQEFHSGPYRGMGVAFGAYDLVSRYVRKPLSVPGALTEAEKGLFAPPQDVEAFRQLCREICDGQLVQSYLG